jgi:membrane protease YdiL (CAAX protease family)
VWTVFVALFAALVLAVVFQAALGAILTVIELSRGTDPAQLQQVMMDRLTQPYGFLLLVAAAQLGFLVTGLIAALSSAEPFGKRVAWSAPRPSWRVYPIAMLSSIPPLAVGLGSAWALATVLPADESLAKLFDAFTIDSAIVFVLVIGIVPGLVEELLYRGYAQKRLVERWGPLAGITVTSILFALVHGAPHAIVAAAPLGFWFGYLAWRSGSILPTILCHFFVNSGLNAWRMVIKFAEPSTQTQIAFSVTAVIVGIFCFAICCWPAFWRGKGSGAGSDSNGGH